jgi:uncharacterized protein (DUF169 family)
MHSRDILIKAKGDHLDSVCSDQKVLMMIRQGRLVLVSGGQGSRQLTQKRLSGLIPLISDGSRDS